MKGFFVQRFFCFLLMFMFTCFACGAADDQTQERLRFPLLRIAMRNGLQSEERAQFHEKLGSELCSAAKTAANLWYIVSAYKGLGEHLNRVFCDTSKAQKGFDVFTPTDWNGIGNSLGNMYDSALDLGRKVEPLPLGERDPLYLCGLAIHLDGYDEPYCVEFDFDGWILRRAVLNRDACIPTKWYSDTAIYYALRNEEDDQEDTNAYIKTVPYAEIVEDKNVSYASALRELLQKNDWHGAAKFFFSKQHAVDPFAFVMVDYAVWKRYMDICTRQKIKRLDDEIAYYQKQKEQGEAEWEADGVGYVIEDLKDERHQLANSLFWDGTRRLDHCKDPSTVKGTALCNQ